jgi:prevent-host-death family protein
VDMPPRTTIRAVDGTGQRSGAPGADHCRAIPSHMCYNCGMAEVASRELRNDTRGLLRRVAAGEDIVITVAGEPVAALRPLNRRPRWISGADFARRLVRRQADPELLVELRALASDTTDDLPL